jgi:hypothetical protein
VVQAEAQAAQSLSKLLGPLRLDPLTVADDGTFVERLGGQQNLPGYVKGSLTELF